MSKKRVHVSQATNEQLRAFAVGHLGIDFPETTKRPHMIAQISAAGHAQIEVEDEAPPEAVQSEPSAVRERIKPASRALGSRSAKDEPRVTILIPDQQGKGGDRPVPVAVNGTFILLPRREEITIPYRYYEALKNAVREDIEHVQLEGQIGMTLRSTMVPAYPFSVIDMPRAEVAAWQARKRKAQEERAARRREAAEAAA